MGKKRIYSDEYYVLDICDEVIGETGSRQYKFPYLIGSTGRPLPVDIFYENKKLVIEYREKQHYIDVSFFDKPKKMTASGVPRNIQRKMYDKKRETILPSKGIDIVVIPYFDLDSKKNGKLKRNYEYDKMAIMKLLEKYIYH